MKIFQILITLMLFTNLFAGSIPVNKVNELLSFKKKIYLDKYAKKSIKKPIKQNYKVFKELKRGLFEKTLAFKQRVQKEKLKIERSNRNIDLAYEKSLKKYKNSLKSQELKLQKAKENLPNYLSKSLNDILNIALGTPIIEALKDNDASQYNADDEVFITKISSNKFSIPIHLQMSVSDAQKLYKSKHLKDVQPIVLFEYSDNNLYISEVIVKYKKKKYSVAISDLKDYDTSFKLKYRVSDTIIKWTKHKSTDKDLNNYLKGIKPKKETPISLKDATREEPKTAIIKPLSWQKQISKKRYTFNEATQYCKNLTLNKHKDWRVPKINELRSILKKIPILSRTTQTKKTYIDSSLIKASSLRYPNFWSSTAYKNSAIYYMMFDIGGSSHTKASDKYYVSCVREK